MPEGVEVTLFANSLHSFLNGKSLVDIEILSGRYIKKLPENFLEFKRDIPLCINEVKNKGKCLFFLLGNNGNTHSIISTLGMTGGWTTRQTKHAKVRFLLNTNENVYFTDVRNFGTLSFFNDLNKVKKKESQIGFDIVNNNLEINQFINISRKYNKDNICDFLMRQDILSGIGNYIKAESLWLANINPWANISNLSDDDLSLLYSSIKDVCNLSLTNGGASIKNYFNFENEKGESTDFFNVYGKKLDTLGNNVIKEDTPDKRTTHCSPLKQIKGL